MEPCPFCSAKNNQVVTLDYGQGFAVFCFGCAATGPQCESPEEAHLAWTAREIDEEDSVFL
jgi:pyruvate-formate lyase-activating enzyme